MTQASGVPGHGTVAVTGPDGITQTYSVYFAHRARSDDFSGTSVGPQWTWLRQDPANERVSGGALTITPEQGDLSGTNPPARNVLLQPALGNWAMVSKLTFSSVPHVANQQGGLIAYEDDANWLKLCWPGGRSRADENGLMPGSPSTPRPFLVPASPSLVWRVGLPGVPDCCQEHACQTR